MGWLCWCDDESNFELLEYEGVCEVPFEEMSGDDVNRLRLNPCSWADCGSSGGGVETTEWGWYEIDDDDDELEALIDGNDCIMHLSEVTVQVKDAFPFCKKK